jgi:hypothetical protein
MLQLTGTGTIFAPSKGSVNSNAVDEPMRKDAIEGNFMVGWMLQRDKKKSVSIKSTSTRQIEI